MSIWTSPLFGRARPATPASPVAVRCARLRAAHSIDLLPAMLMGGLGGLALFTIALFVALASATATPGTPMAAAALALVKGFGPAPMAWSIGLLVILISLGPRSARWFFDLKANGLTLEEIAKRRRRRKPSSRLVIAFALLAILAASAGAAFGAWQGMAIIAAKSAATTGGMIAGLALRTRRGSRPVCARCDYPLHTWRGAGDRCPECGNQWRRPWRARFGARGVQWRTLEIGAALLVASALLLAGVGRWGLK